jgi:hypothetical protein
MFDIVPDLARTTFSAEYAHPLRERPVVAGNRQAGHPGRHPRGIEHSPQNGDERVGGDRVTT